MLICDAKETKEGHVCTGAETGLELESLGSRRDGPNDACRLTSTDVSSDFSNCHLYHHYHQALNLSRVLSKPPPDWNDRSSGQQLHQTHRNKNVIHRTFYPTWTQR